MGKNIVVTGRGGAGKSTFTALAARCVGEAPLLVDADPDQCLAYLLGVDLSNEDVNTVSQMLYDLQDRGKLQELRSMPLVEQIEYMLHMSCLYEGEDFDLLTLGVKWTQGCYCQPNNVLRSLIPELGESYEYTFVDSPAGLEHLNRRIMDRIDDLFVVMDPSSKSVREVNRLQQLTSSINIEVENLYAVANHDFDDEMEKRLHDLNGVNYLGRLKNDKNVIDCDWRGESLWTLPEDSPAVASVRNLLEKAGYSPESTTVAE